MPLISQVWADWSPSLEGPCTEVKKKKASRRPALKLAHCHFLSAAMARLAQIPAIETQTPYSQGRPSAKGQRPGEKRMAGRLALIYHTQVSNGTG